MRSGNKLYTTRRAQQWCQPQTRFKVLLHASKSPNDHQVPTTYTELDRLGLTQLESSMQLLKHSRTHSLNHPKHQAKARKHPIMLLLLMLDCYVSASSYYPTQHCCCDSFTNPRPSTGSQLYPNLQAHIIHHRASKNVIAILGLATISRFRCPSLRRPLPSSSLTSIHPFIENLVNKRNE
jgi:hypothetical protein